MKYNPIIQQNEVIHMLTKEQFHEKIASGVRFLDGATGSNLQKVGMPKGCCTEE